MLSPARRRSSIATIDRPHDSSHSGNIVVSFLDHNNQLPAVRASRVWKSRRFVIAFGTNHVCCLARFQL